MFELAYFMYELTQKSYVRNGLCTSWPGTKYSYLWIFSAGRNLSASWASSPWTSWMETSQGLWLTSPPTSQASSYTWTSYVRLDERCWKGMMYNNVPENNKHHVNLKGCWGGVADQALNSPIFFSISGELLVLPCPVHHTKGVLNLGTTSKGNSNVVSIELYWCSAQGGKSTCMWGQYHRNQPNEQNS